MPSNPPLVWARCGLAWTVSRYGHGSPASQRDRGGGRGRAGRARRRRCAAGRARTRRRTTACRRNRAASLDVEVGPGQHTTARERVDDRERDPVVGIAQADEALHIYVPAIAAERRLQIGLEQADAQLEVGRVLDRAVAVVGHDPVAPLAGRQRGREALDGLAGERDRTPLIGAEPSSVPEIGPGAKVRAGRTARPSSRAWSDGDWARAATGARSASAASSPAVRESRKDSLRDQGSGRRGCFATRGADV
jgi:hypothetical protein